MIEEMKQDYDWQEAFNFCSSEDIRKALPGSSVSREGFTIDDVERIFAADEGENDESEWLALGKLKDGRWFLLSAWCDYTGWDCQSGGTTTVANSLEELIRYGMTGIELRRLRL